MATKKQAPKKAARASKPAKPSRPSGGKAPAKKPAAKKPAKPAPKKAVAKKTVPVKKSASNKSAPKKAVKPAKPAPKKQAPPAPKKAAKSVKPAPKPLPAKPVKPAAAPVKKPVVAAPTHKEVKPVIQPLQKPPVKAARPEPPKPVKVVIPKTSTTKSVKYEPEFTKSVLDAHNQQSTGPTMRYSDSELTEFRELIQRKLDTAKKELAYLQGLITRKDESGDLDEGRYMTMEDGSMSMEREQLSQMASRQIQFIDHLEKAIMRIENKTYGICRVTGKLIDKARLRAVPHATLSIEAKQMMNK